MIKHPLFISRLSVKYVHPSQRGQQAVKHIKWTLGPGQLSAEIMWPLCKLCSIENTFYVQDNRCKVTQSTISSAKERFCNEVMLFEHTSFFIGSGFQRWNTTIILPSSSFGLMQYFTDSNKTTKGYNVTLQNKLILTFGSAFHEKNRAIQRHEFCFFS